MRLRVLLSAKETSSAHGALGGGGDPAAEARALPKDEVVRTITLFACIFSPLPIFNFFYY